MKTVFVARQGDVLIRSISSIPKTAKRENGRIVLAYGEVTGHCHEIEEVERVELYTLDGKMYLRVKEEANLMHQEHSTITIPRGVFEVSRQLEYTPESIKQVAD